MANMVQWVVAHQGLVAGLGVAVLDLIFALVPSVQSNGILHWAYGMLMADKSKQ